MTHHAPMSQKLNQLEADVRRLESENAALKAIVSEAGMLAKIDDADSLAPMPVSPVRRWFGQRVAMVLLTVLIVGCLYVVHLLDVSFSKGVAEGYGAEQNPPAAAPAAPTVRR